MIDIGWMIVKKKIEKWNKYIDIEYVEEFFLGMYIWYLNLL